MVKNLPTMWETWVCSLGWEDPLEKGMATHSSMLVWTVPWIEEPGGLQSTGLQRVRHDWWLRHTHCKHGIRNVLLTVQVFPFANGSDFSRNKFVIGKNSHWVFMRNLSNSRNIQKCLRPEISQVMYIHWGGAVRDLLWEWGKYWSSYLYLLLKYHLLISMCFIMCVILFSSRMY